MGLWQTVAPILPVEIIPNRISEVGSRVRLTALPEWFKLERKFTSKTLGALKTIESEACLLAESSGFDEPEHRASMDALRVALLSLWLGRPSSLTFEFAVTTEPSASPRILSTELMPGIKPRIAYVTATLSAGNVAEAHIFAKVIGGLHKPSPLWTAAKFLWFALTEEVWELRFVNLWIALEAVLGPTNRQRVQKRIAMRLARLLNTDDNEGQKAYQIAFESYEWRCAAVHGSRLSELESDRAESLMLEAEGMIRSSLRKILVEDSLVSVFSSTDRDSHLEGLTEGFTPPTS